MRTTSVRELHIHTSELVVAGGLWTLIPVTGILLQRTSAKILAAPRDILLRSADAILLATAQEAGEKEIWTSDPHMLAATPHFGLTGRSI